ADELDIARPAPSECGDEYRKAIASTADGREVGLHLATRIGLEANHRIGLHHRSQRREVILQDAVTTSVPERSQLPQQHCRRNPIRRRRLYSLVDVLLKRIELAWSRLTLIARQSIAAQIATYRVARDIEYPCDLSDALALPS